MLELTFRSHCGAQERRRIIGDVARSKDVHGRTGDGGAVAGGVTARVGRRIAICISAEKQCLEEAVTIHVTGLGVGAAHLAFGHVHVVGPAGLADFTANASEELEVRELIVGDPRAHFHETAAQERDGSVLDPIAVGVKCRVKWSDIESSISVRQIGVKDAVGAGVRVSESGSAIAEDPIDSAP